MSKVIELAQALLAAVEEEAKDRPQSWSLLMDTLKRQKATIEAQRAELWKSRCQRLTDAQRIEMLQKELNAMDVAFTKHRNESAKTLAAKDAAIARLGKRIAKLEAEKDGDGWIEWQGGECPVARDTIVDLKLRTMGVPLKTVAGDWRWSNENHSGDITAYRVVKEATPQAMAEAVDETIARIGEAALRRNVMKARGWET